MFKILQKFIFLFLLVLPSTLLLTGNGERKRLREFFSVSIFAIIFMSDDVLGIWDDCADREMPSVRMCWPLWETLGRRNVLFLPLKLSMFGPFFVRFEHHLEPSSCGSMISIYFVWGQSHCWLLLSSLFRFVRQIRIACLPQFFPVVSDCVRGVRWWGNMSLILECFSHSSRRRSGKRTWCRWGLWSYGGRRIRLGGHEGMERVNYLCVIIIVVTDRMRDDWRLKG